MRAFLYGNHNILTKPMDILMLVNQMVNKQSLTSKGYELNFILVATNQGLISNCYYQPDVTELNATNGYYPKTLYQWLLANS